MADTLKIPSLRIRKQAPNSTNIQDNLVGQEMRQQKKVAHQSFRQRIDNERDQIEGRLKARISQTKRLDVIA